MRKTLLFISFFIILATNTAFAKRAPVDPDALQLFDIKDNVKAIVGPIDQRTSKNFGNNANFGVIITSKGVVLVDSGGSYLGAKAIHDMIKTVTDQPIKYVINSGGQDHRWFGNNYFKALGAKVISSNAAKEDHEARLNMQWTRLEMLIGKESIKGTNPEFADITFEKDYELKLGDTVIEIHHHGQAHTPGDAFVWLPKEKVMFSGDIVYVDRMLGIGPQSNSKSWMSVFEAMASYDIEVLVPGHGKPTTLANATKATYDYLKFIREAAAKVIDDDGDMTEVVKVDQSQFNDLYNFKALSGRNIQKAFSEMEFE